MPDITVTTYEGAVAAENLGYTVRVTDGVAIPPGGTTGQRLAKASDANYDYEWVDGSGGGSTVSVDADGTVTVDATTVELATDAQLTAHEADTTNVHGIANTALLETTSGAQTKADAAQAAAEATAANADNLTSGTVADARIASTIARDSEVAAAISASEAGQVRDGDAAGGVLAGTYPNPSFAVDMATQAELDAEAALARNADNLTSGTVADARIASTIARDSEVTAAVSASEAGQVRDGDAAGGVLSGTYPNPGFAADMATQAELDAHVNDTSAAHAASAVSVTPTGAIASTDVQAALAELDSEKATTGSVTTVSNDLAAHLADTSDAHDASAISYNGSAGLSATDVEAALDELDTEKAAASHTHAAADIASGTIAPARLGSGSGGSTKFLREDSTWQTVSAGGSLATDALADAKGDIFVATAADTITRLAVGSDGKAVIGASAETKGIKWGNPARGIDVAPSSPSSLDDEFDDTTGMSGPTNGINARWSFRNIGTAGWKILDDTKAPGAFLLDLPTGQPADQAMYQTAPAGDFRIAARVQRLGSEGRQMWGLFSVDSSGNGISILVDDSNNEQGCYIRTIAGWVQSGAPVIVNWAANNAWTGGVPVVLSLRKASGVYHAAVTVGDLAAKDGLYEVSHTPTAFTPAYVGFGRMHASNSQAKVAIDWFRKW